ncbi:monooxygenase [Apiospora rasikravindrae]|uniref:Monooxygenase n=1 Tax=Apiospora rasikravindrae TaxID=990691 RepID=A0ABR1T214_9PEZI
MECQPTAFLARPLRIIVIGAGISGIQFLKDATHRLENVTITVYDKNDDIGGTWLENRYPGWNPNPEWSQLYASAQEIHRYLTNTVDAFGLRKYVRFGTECVGAEWNEDSSEWLVSFRDVHDGRTMTRLKCDVFVYAVGRLNNWKMPDITGLANFQGRILHTASWPRDVQLGDKDVAVIGNGASAVQCIAGIHQVTRKVYNIVRSGTWLVPHVFSRNGEPQVDYTDEEIGQWKADPDSYLDFRYRLEQQLASSFAGLWLGASSEAFTRRAAQHMDSKIQDARTRAALVPDFPAGCRRFTPADRYIDALNQSHDGASYPVDVVVCATGFDPYTPRFSVRGRAGLELQELWSDQGGYESYMAAAVAGFPNFFAFNPPICPVNGSAFPGIERTSDYIIRVLSRLQTDNLKSIAVTHDAQTTFNKWVQERMASMVWSGPCSSWCKSAFIMLQLVMGLSLVTNALEDKTESGKVIVPWPGTILHYYRATEVVRWEDFDLRFQDGGMKYGSFGNGITSEGFVPKGIPWLRGQSRGI